MSKSASTRLDMDSTSGTPATKRPKISTRTDSASAEQQQQKKRFLLILVLADGKGRSLRKFAFPMEYVYDNLAALLGLKKNPWGDLVCEQNDDEVAAAPPQENETIVSPSPSATIVTVESKTLCELDVRHELCCAYVRYCRTGEGSTEAYNFLLLAAGPDHLLKQIEKSRLKLIIHHEISNFGSRYSCSEKQDYLHYYDEWLTSVSDSRRDKRLAENKFVRLYTDDGDIDDLRSRIRTMLWKLDDVVTAVSRGMRNDVLEIMRGCYLPFYHVPLLGENEADDGSKASNIV